MTNTLSYFGPLIVIKKKNSFKSYFLTKIDFLQVNAINLSFFVIDALVNCAGILFCAG
jgi:hypothetical protein